ncbi:hypothetical protein MRX96_039832 [Rhipicephalus microplus]
MQDELLYMRAKGLSWKDIEEADQANERRENAAICMLILAIFGLGCFLVVKLYTLLETTAASEFFVSPEDRPGVLNHTHEWLGALSAEPEAQIMMVEPDDGSSPDPGSRSGSSSAGFATRERIRPRRSAPFPLTSPLLRRARRRRCSALGMPRTRRTCLLHCRTRPKTRNSSDATD